jgi:hypothetical protein
MARSCKALCFAGVLPLDSTDISCTSTDIYAILGPPNPGQNPFRTMPGHPGTVARGDGRTESAQASGREDANVRWVYVCIWAFTYQYVRMGIDNSRGYLGPRQNLQGIQRYRDWNPHDHVLRPEAQGQQSTFHLP